jgi:cytochrome c biogenesis protein CcdA
MDIIFSASIIAAFLAGMVALFAPCCITVLLPAYLASAFREKRNILKMTLVFFSGIAAVLVPIGLGAAGLAELFRDYHREMYIFGGLLMMFLAVMAVSGKGLSMIPMSKKITPGGDMSHPKSVFLLGIFSGAATSCCAPVLAGAITLAAISGAFWKALIVTFSYVFGMTFPLFVTAYFYDRFKIEKSRLIKGRLLRLSFASKTFFVHSTNLLAGIVFFIMGIILLVLAFSGNVFWSPAFQAKIGSALNVWSQNALNALSVIPDFVWGFIIIGLFSFFLYATVKNRLSVKENKNEEKEKQP